MLPDVSGNDLAMLRIRVSENVLDEVIAVLVAGNVDEGNSGAVHTPLTNSIKVAAEKLGATDLEALLDNLGSKLIHRILSSVSNDMVNGTAPVRRSSVLADVLDAPVAELTVGDDIDVGKDLFNAVALGKSVSITSSQDILGDTRTLSSSRQFSKIF